jgi:hypothetical protein
MDLSSEQELDDIAKALEKLKGLLEKAQTVED